VPAVIFGFGIYELGGINRVQDYRELQSTLVETNQERDMLHNRAVELQGEVASLRQRRDLDQQARLNDAAELTRLRHQLTELRQELELYSSLADQSVTESPVSVHRFEIKPTAVAGKYRYDLMLTQPLASAQKIEGKVEIVLADSAGNSVVGEHGFGFQLFEKFSGLLLPTPSAALSNISVVLKITLSSGAVIVHEFPGQELFGEEPVDEKSK